MHYFLTDSTRGCETTTPAVSYISSGDQTQLLVFARQALCKLSSVLSSLLPALFTMTTCLAQISHLSRLYSFSVVGSMARCLSVETLDSL